MKGCVVQAWFEPESEAFPDRRARFQIVETELPDFATFCEFVEADRLIGGAILYCHKQPDGTSLIHRRVPCAFRGSTVLRCQLPGWKFVEEEKADA